MGEPFILTTSTILSLSRVMDQSSFEIGDSKYKEDHRVLLIWTTSTNSSVYFEVIPKPQ